jgi:hypothetical protein
MALLISSRPSTWLRGNGSDEAVRAYLDWLAIVTRDEHEGFQCRVLSAGDARQAPGSGWHDVF